MKRDFLSIVATCILELLKQNGFYHELYYSQFAQTVAE